MKLKLKDRIVFTQLFPQSGGMLEQLTARDIGKKTEITQEDIKEYEIRQETVGSEVFTKWKVEKDVGKEIDFSEVELNFLKDQVDRLDKAKQITPDLLDLCLLIKK
jgi:hypothetical protein